MDTFELAHGDRYGATVVAVVAVWKRFIPFLTHPAVIRKIVHSP
jgi:hypothetical protein